MVLRDEEIKKRIVDQLYWDTSVDASKVQVKVENGKVTLTGTVPNYNARRRAESDACQVRDVLWVDNRLIVQYPSIVAVPTDSEIKQSIVRMLSDNPDLDTAEIHVKVQDGCVTLEGSVDAYWKKWEATNVGSKVRGICDIRNILTVVPTHTISDKAIAEEVAGAIERNRNVDLEDVDVEVEDGVVTLTGSVPNWAARMAAVNAAEFTQGVIDVIDNLSIRAPIL